MKFTLALILLGCLCQANEIRISPSDTSRPATVRAHVSNGSIVVSGYDGKEIIAESRSVTGSDQGNNVIRLAGTGEGNLTIRVPFATNLKLECTNGGNIKVDHVTGDLELSNLNGGVYAANVSGSVVATSQNGRVKVDFDKVTPGRDMSFTTLNGSVDVTFPADTKATAHMRSDNGSIQSDFDLRLAPGTYGRGKSITGAINGGGPDMTFRTINGSVYLRKK
jgi:hypothetical protein